MSTGDSEPMKNEEKKQKKVPPQSNDDGFDFSDLNGIQDAGESEEAKQAESEARQVKINMQHRRDTMETARAEAYGESNLVKRAKLLASLQAIKFVHFKPTQNDFAIQARTDSEMNRFAVFDALFDFGKGTVPFPHYDTFRGRMVDHRGETFTPKNLEVRELVEAVNYAGLDNPSAKQVADSYYNWAAQHRFDGLVDNIKLRIPEWDGKERLTSLLVDLFQPNDTELNRRMSKYFWLSLYNRIMSPGCLAPISIALIGGQNAGKSYFSELICKIIMNDPFAKPIKLDYAARNYNTFLRNITGKSIIANVGEMTGFKRADIERMKDFAAATGDELDFKFEDTIVKPRQWITIMDGNSYDGLQRDDTGNRRFYPIFVAQEPDRHGMPAWREQFKVDFSNFAEDLWQVMAECREWMNENKMKGYVEFVNETSAAVSEFSQYEMRNARGVVRDELIDTNLIQVLLMSDYEKHAERGWFLTTSEIRQRFLKMERQAPHARSMVPHMTKLGYAQGMYRNIRGWWLPFIEGENGSVTDLCTLLAFMLKEDGSDFESDIAYVRACRNKGDAF